MQDAPICGLEVESDEGGFWVNADKVCRRPRKGAKGGQWERWGRCREGLVVCGREAYGDAREHVCNSPLVWRPIRCRHVVWTSPDLPHVNAEAAKNGILKLKEKLRFYGDSTVRELSDLWKMSFPNFKEIQLRDIATSCEQTLPHWLERADWKLFIWRSSPASHPYLGRSLSASFGGFHGQRMFLTNGQLKDFNTLTRGLLERSSLTDKRFLFLDEFAITEPTKGMQTDGLHVFYNTEAQNLVVSWTVFNCFLSLLVEAMRKQIIGENSQNFTMSTS